MERQMEAILTKVVITLASLLFGMSVLWVLSEINETLKRIENVLESFADDSTEGESNEWGS